MKNHRQIRMLMVLVYLAFGFAYRIMMIPPSSMDTHDPNLTGDLMMNYDIISEIIGAKSIIDGSFDMYVNKYSKDVVPDTGVALPYPPLTAYMQVPIVFVGMKLGMDPFGMTMFMLCGLPYIVLGALCALQAGRVLKNPLKVSDEMTVTATVFLLLFSSLMFWVGIYSARFEFVAALFLLLAMSALASERCGWAGFCLGLAIMTKTIVLPAVGVFVVVVFFSMLRKEIQPRKAMLFLTMLLVPFGMLIPFLIADPAALADGLLRTPSLLPIMKVSFVNLVLQVGKHIFDEGALREFLKLRSNLIILAFCAGFIVVVAKRKDVRLGTDQFCALVALASFFFPLLGKYTYIGKYAVMASVFVVVWGASRKPGLPYDALWFVVLQSAILDHVPVIWKTYVGLIFYALVFLYVYFMAFSGAEGAPPQKSALSLSP